MNTANRTTDQIQSSFCSQYLLKIVALIEYVFVETDRSLVNFFLSTNLVLLYGHALT